MKRKLSNTAFSCFLITTLVFSQVVVNLLHSSHDYHRPVTELQKKGVPSIQEHNEHCKVCSLDNLFNLLSNPSFQLDTSFPEAALADIQRLAASQFSASFAQDRAPPVLIF